MDDETRRTRYRELRESLPELFVNPPDAPFAILEDPADVTAAEEETARLLVLNGKPAEWARTGVVFEDPYGLTIRDAVRTPGGQRGTYVRRINPGNAAGVVVLPVLDGDAVLVRHFRHSTRQWHLEAPRGFGEPGASPDEDARRELLEEIGATPTRLVPLGVVYPDTGQMATPVQLFFAEVGSYGAASAEEGIEAIRLVPPPELAELIRSGELTDGFTINAYTRAFLRGLLPTPKTAG
jgi:ADP-ribose pyrophosphatase